MARKTFGSAVLLYNDVALEIVSELTQHVRSNVVKADLPTAAERRRGSFQYKDTPGILRKSRAEKGQ
ncbi:MAG: hypothetical protein WBM91_16115 [Eudoraea sp.]|uniref:hypothetical protein n=1 Tax=Eudoraea sp. TaxID=1979955 RepID=UPI003C756516